MTTNAATSDVTTPRPSRVRYSDSAPRAIGAPHDLEHHHGARDAVAERRHTAGVGVDHLVQGLDVQTWSGAGGIVANGVTGKGPQVALQV